MGQLCNNVSPLLKITNSKNREHLQILKTLRISGNCFDCNRLSMSFLGSIETFLAAAGFAGLTCLIVALLIRIKPRWDRTCENSVLENTYEQPKSAPSISWGVEKHTSNCPCSTKFPKSHNSTNSHLCRMQNKSMSTPWTPLEAPCHRCTKNNDVNRRSNPRSE